MPLKQLHIDYHCHILPGIDDGPREEDESVEMARLLALAGARRYRYLIAHPERCSLLEIPEREVQHTGRWQRWLARSAAIHNDSDSDNDNDIESDSEPCNELRFFLSTHRFLKQ